MKLLSINCVTKMTDYLVKTKKKQNTDELRKQETYKF